MRGQLILSGGLVGAGEVEGGEEGGRRAAPIRADGSRPPSSDVTCIATHVGFGLRTIGNQIEAFSLITMRHLQAIMYVLAWPPHWVGQWPVQVCLEIILL